MLEYSVHALQQRLQRLQQDNRRLHNMLAKSEQMHRQYSDALVILRETKEDLQAREALIEAILNVVMECIIGMDQQGRVTEFNAAAEKMFGYQREDVLGQDLSCLIIPESLRKRHRRALSRLLQGKSNEKWLNQRVETRAMRADGSVFPIELIITRVYQHDTVIFPAFIRDLSEKKAIEAALQQRVVEAETARVSMQWALDELHASRASLERAKHEWEHTFDAVTEPIFLHDEQDLILRANRAYARYAKMSIEDTLGKPYWKVFPLLDGPLKSSREVSRKSMEEEVHTPDGRILVSNVYTVCDAEGEYCYSVHFMRDVTERMRVTERLKKSLEGTIRAIAAAVEARDPYTAGHQQRVAELAVAIARYMDLDESVIEGIYLGGKIHDIGKIHLAAEILSKPTRLTELEYELIREHAQIGYTILKDIEFPWPIAEIAYQHHERIDGSGYPQGLKGADICLEARIVAVADVVEAMTTDRPYRPGLGIERALDEIKRGRGIQYDADVVDACLNLFQQHLFRFAER